MPVTNHQTIPSQQKQNKKMMKKQLGFISAFMIFLLGINAGFAQDNKTELKIEDFDKVEIGSFFQVNLYPSEVSKVVFNATEQNQKRIKPAVKNKTLKLDFDGNGYSPSGKNKVEVDVYYTTLKSISASGVSEVYTQQPIENEVLKLKCSGAATLEAEIKVKELYSDFSGAVTVKLSGTATKHFLDASGAANIKAYELKTQNTEASVSGASMAYVEADKKLSGTVSGVAKLKYDEEAEEVEINKSQTVEETIERAMSKTDFSDSVNVKMGKFNIEVIDSDTMTIKMGRSEIKIDDKGNVDIGKSKKKPRFDGHWSGFYLGVNGFLNKDQELDIPADYEKLDLKYEKSIDVQINFYEQNFNLIGEKLGLITGLGLQWDNYRFDNDVILSMEGDTLGFDDPNPERDYKKSKLLTTYLNVPLFLEFQTNSDNDFDSFHLSAGIIGGWRIGSHSKVVYDGRNKNKEREDFYTNPFRADAAFRIGWGKINLYAGYNLIPLFKDDKGPELYPFNAGLQIIDL